MVGAESRCGCRAVITNNNNNQKSQKVAFCWLWQTWKYWFYRIIMALQEASPRPCSPWHTMKEPVSPTVCPCLSVILPFYMMPLNLWWKITVCSCWDATFLLFFFFYPRVLFLFWRVLMYHSTLKLLKSNQYLKKKKFLLCFILSPPSHPQYCGWSFPNPHTFIHTQTH